MGQAKGERKNQSSFNWLGQVFVQGDSEEPAGSEGMLGVR